MSSINRLLAGILALMCAVPAVASTPPNSHTVRFLLREIPTDLTSDVLYEIELALEPDSWDSTGVDWDVSKMTVSRLNDFGKTDATWIATNPLAGLWSVAHADISNPIPGEFDVAPLMSGVADAVDPDEEDLVFTFESALYDPIGPWPPVPTGAVQYNFELADSETTEVSGDDEPMEIEEDDSGT